MPPVNTSVDRTRVSKETWCAFSPMSTLGDVVGTRRPVCAGSPQKPPVGPSDKQDSTGRHLFRELHPLSENGLVLQPYIQGPVRTPPRPLRSIAMLVSQSARKPGPTWWSDSLDPSTDSTLQPTQPRLHPPCRTRSLRGRAQARLSICKHVDKSGLGSPPKLALLHELLIHFCTSAACTPSQA